MDYLADRTKLIDASGIRKVFALAAQLDDPVNFSIGQPDFDVPDVVKDAAIDAIRKGYNKYSQTAGLEDVVACLKAKIAAEYGWDNPPLMITDGVSGGLLLAFMALINPGDEVIVQDPYFVMYKHLVRMLGGKCVYINTYPDFRLPVEKIEAAITDKTKLICLNSPANPTGAVYTEKEVNDIAQLAQQNNIIVLSDEIYEEFCYDAKNPSIGTYYDKAIILRGFSKSHAMTGWRLGYAAVSEKLAPLLDKMLMIQQYTFVCAPTPFQMAIPAAMECDTTAYVDQYHKKRDRMLEGLGKCFDITRPAGAFYMFIKAPDKYPNATAFVKKAIENNVLIIPGNVFSEQDTHFRISYVATDEKIEQGIKILCNLAM
ncbi:MAG: aminotransferase class I/II-fold pyridoxal phosphate-dependent enzyme [Phycisphaerae bacterium]|nr:aminotransferase class I/II-fold pyridoxal phosphate-dependent enzyme [Phycisphaerae bacterium]